MNRHIEKAKELRSPQKCYNCAETIMMAYADDLGLTESQAECLGCNFGGGMKCGGTCGAITGGLMVLGALGIANMWFAIFADVGVMILAVLNAIRTLFVKKL